MMTACTPPTSNEQPVASEQPVANEGEAIAQAREGRWLILEFPDGVRGRGGSIQGEGQWTDFTFAGLVERVSACGAEDARRVDAWSHYGHVISRSTPRDRDVVRCVKQGMPRRFSAGVGSDDPRQFSDMDRTPFREFETRPHRGD